MVVDFFPLQFDIAETMYVVGIRPRYRGAHGFERRHVALCSHAWPILRPAAAWLMDTIYFFDSWMWSAGDVLMVSGACLALVGIAVGALAETPIPTRMTHYTESLKT